MATFADEIIMARLDGAKTNVVPYVVGAVLIAVLASGAYYYFRSKGTQPDDAQNSTSLSTMTRAKATPATNDGAPVDETATASPTDGGDSTGTSADASKPLPSGTDAGTSNSGMPEGTPSPASSSTPTTPDTAATPATSGTLAPKSQATANGVVAKRSKTITNHKTGTTVTYSKEVHKDGTVTHDKKTGTVPVRP